MTIPDDSTASASPTEGHPPLAGADPLRAHVAFESASDRQDRIRRWPVERPLTAEGAGLDVAGVGAGSGILDVPPIERVSASESLRSQMFEPVAERCERVYATDPGHADVVERLGLTRAGWRGAGRAAPVATSPAGRLAQGRRRR
jgi:hypothetical protein